MVKRCIWAFLIAFVLVLSACGETKDADAEDRKIEEIEKQDQTEAENEKETEVNEPTEKAEVKEEETKALTVEEVQQIINENIEERERIMQAIQEEKKEWWTQNWSLDREDEGEEFQAAVSVVRESLAAIMTENALNEVAELYTRMYFCQCDWIADLEDDVGSRVEIIEQSEDHFQVKSITLVELGLHAQGGTTNLWEFQKEGDSWKLDQHKSISPDEEPLSLTFEDLKEAFDNRIEFVEVIEYEGEEYIVILYDSGVYSSWNISDGSDNYELSSKYNGSDERDSDTSDKESEPEQDGYMGFSAEELKDMDPFGGDWDRVDNNGEGQGFLSARPPYIDLVIIDTDFLISGILQRPSGNKARFYDEESGCELDLILKDEETIEVKEVTECSAHISSPDGVYEKNFNR